MRDVLARLESETVDVRILSKRRRIAPSDMAAEPLLVFCRRDYPEYWEIVTSWLRAHRIRPGIAGEYDGLDSLMAAVESGLGVALVTRRTAGRVPRRVLLRDLAASPDPLCIAVGHRAGKTEEKFLSEFMAELRATAAHLV